MDIKKICLAGILVLSVASAEGFGVDRIGLMIGQSSISFESTNEQGTIVLDTEPEESFLTMEPYITFGGVGLGLSPYVSLSQSSNDVLSQTNLLLGISKYFEVQGSNIELYGGLLAGYGLLTWDTNPIGKSGKEEMTTNSYVGGIQAGFDYALTKNFLLGLNAKLLAHEYVTDLADTQNNKGTIKHNSTIFAGLALTYKFGENRAEDTDGDGISDKVDRCPNTPAGKYVNRYGCAKKIVVSKDTDGDGISDKIDRCPNTPAGKYVNKYGCAKKIVKSKDKDGDGISDKMDSCSNTPKDIKVDAKGCAMDYDSDGVGYYKDKCPTTPKGFNVDKEGCLISYSLDIKFDSGKAKVKKLYYPQISTLVNYLKKKPGRYTIHIEAHTDSDGSARYNELLSQRRAKAVSDTLVEFEVPAQSITYKGYGESKPIVANDTAANKAKNRRIEVNLNKK